MQVRALSFSLYYGLVYSRISDPLPLVGLIHSQDIVYARLIPRLQLGNYKSLHHGQNALTLTPDSRFSE